MPSDTLYIPSMNHAGLKDTVEAEERIITEAGMQLETDSRVSSTHCFVRSQRFRVHQERATRAPIQRNAFYSSKQKTDTPILLLEAKRLGSDLAHKNR